MLAGAMFGLNAIGFSIMPGAIRTLSAFHRLMAKPAIFVAPLFCTLLALELLDRYNLFGTLPLCLSAGIIISISYQKARALGQPLWLSRQVSRLGTFWIITLLFAGYCMLLREMENNETKVAIKNI